MKEKQLLSSTESSATGEWVSFRPETSPYALVVVTVEDTGTVTLQGKLTSDDTILTLRTASTETEGFVVSVFPLMRAISSGVSGGVVRVTVAEVR